MAGLHRLYSGLAARTQKPWIHRSTWRHPREVMRKAMTPRIAFLIPRLDVGGAQRQLVELASGLQSDGWQVRILAFYGGGALEPELRERGIDFRVLEKRGRWDFASFAVRLVRDLRRDRPDILHSYLGTPNLLSVLMKPLLPGVRVAWGIRASDMNFERYDWAARFTFRVGCRLSVLADIIVCNSSSGSEFHKANGYPPSKMVVIENGIDTDRYSPDSVARQEIRAEWQVGDGQVLVGMVGRLDLMKDHPTFLQAASELAAEWPMVRFVCIGDGPSEYRVHLTRMASALGLDERLLWSGERLDMSRIYNALDLAVSASCSEGFPNVLAEAMATGVPCVATDVGDSRVVVGDTGWLCRASDSHALAQTIALALQSPGGPRARGAAARKRVIEEFTVASLVAKTSRELTRLL